MPHEKSPRDIDRKADELTERAAKTHARKGADENPVDPGDPADERTATPPRRD